MSLPIATGGLDVRIFSTKPHMSAVLYDYKGNDLADYSKDTATVPKIVAQDGHACVQVLCSWTNFLIEAFAGCMLGRSLIHRNNDIQIANFRILLNLLKFLSP